MKDNLTFAQECSLIASCPDCKLIDICSLHRHLNCEVLTEDYGCIYYQPINVEIKE